MEAPLVETCSHRVVVKKAKADQPPDPGPILDATLQSGNWMVRRKDVVRFATERELKRSHSFDFYVPDCLISRGATSVIVPLGFWWKAPDRYRDIDFVDDTGRSLALPRQDYCTKLTLNMMYEYARRILGYRHARKLPSDVIASIAYVVSNDAPHAIKEVHNEWYGASRGAAGRLAKHEGFLQLLGICALASLFTTTIQLSDQSNGRRHIVKLTYCEQQSSYFETDRYQPEDVSIRSRWAWARVRRWLPRFFGLGVYKLDVANAFVRSQSYHIEAFAPPGLQFATASLMAGEKCKESERLESSLHLHQTDIDENSFATLRSKLLVTDGWITSAIICTAIAVIVLIGIANNAAIFDPAASQNVIAVVLLVPSVAMTIVWRRVHWLVEGLHKSIRYAFLSVGVLLLYLALRIAESPTTQSAHMLFKLSGNHARLVQGNQISRLAVSGEIVTISYIIAGWALAVLVVLLLARAHPARLRNLRNRLLGEV